MSNSERKYWKSVDELNNTPEFQQEISVEFAQEIPVEEIFNENAAVTATNRRDFLKLFGFSIGAAALAACNTTPIKKAIPYLNAPTSVSPSIANYYASTFFDGTDFANVLVKTREGRPIKIEANNLSSVTGHGVSARVSASVLSLYDTYRENTKTAKIDGKDVSWSDFDKEVKGGFQAAKAIRLITPSVVSPSTRALIDRFTATYPTAKHVVYDSISYSGMLEANQATLGKAVIPSYDFKKADVIVSVNADFLGNWLGGLSFVNDYATRRKVNGTDGNMSMHFHFEPALSLTGSNADYRAAYTPSEEGAVVAALYNAVAAATGAAGCGVTGNNLGGLVDNAAKKLVAAKGRSIVVSGSNNKDIQILVNNINKMLGNYGSTIDGVNHTNLRQGIDATSEACFNEIISGSVDAVVLAGVNPVYNHASGDKLKDALKNVKTAVAVAETMDETASACKYVASANHYLESWGDAEFKAGVFSLQQPAISKLYDTRSLEESLMAWTGVAGEYYDFVKAMWRERHFSKQSRFAMFEDFWRQALHDGTFNGGSAAMADNASMASANTANIKGNAGGQEMVIYAKMSLGDGKNANNPWLQEMPDPITKACWDNYLAVNPTYAKKQNLSDGDLVDVTANGVTVKNLPVLMVPGLKEGTFALALGYGRTHVGKAGENIGVNAYRFVSTANGTRSYTVSNVSVKKTGESRKIALTQTHHTIEGRNIVKETTLEHYLAAKKAGKPEEYNLRPHIMIKNEKGEHVKVNPFDETITLWNKRKYEGHHWMIAVDMSACIGCGACVIACQSENNVPVVGRQEVINRREMHWMRIDRYFSFKDKKGGAITKETEYGGESYRYEGNMFRKFENNVQDFSDVETVYQPMMCQQCGNAPCETVCPVLATVHSDEGLNQMAYNRCVGTRYCANNCPYKVRRFNWFSYTDNQLFANVNPVQSDLGKMVLNPDVTVRARGVMEKCTFCVQNIQAGKLEAKKKGTGVEDGSIQTACQRGCPTNAIVFGDINDTNSQVYKMTMDDRAYGVIEEIQVMPSVHYLTKIRNKEEAKG